MYNPWTIGCLLLLVSCVANLPDKPKNTLEGIEAAEITAQQLGSSVTAVTCTKFHVKQCVEPGKVLMPDEAAQLHAKIQEARAALRTAAGLGTEKLGLCLGQSRDQVACLAAARSVLFELEAILTKAKGGGT